jgi:hypothetical protein
MSKAQILLAIPKLSHVERRELMRKLFEFEQDQETLAECDHMAAAHFEMLDAMEAEDQNNASP